MAKTSLIIETTDTGGKKIQKTFTDVNPEASSADLVTFAQMCVGLTNDTYVHTDRIDKINCDTEGTKSAPTFTLSAVTLLQANTYTAPFTYTAGDAKIYTTVYDSTGKYLSCRIDTGNGRILINNPYVETPSSPITISVSLPETDNFKAAVYTKSFNWEG